MKKKQKTQRKQLSLRAHSEPLNPGNPPELSGLTPDATAQNRGFQGNW